MPSFEFQIPKKNIVKLKIFKVGLQENNIAHSSEMENIKHRYFISKFELKIYFVKYIPLSSLNKKAVANLLKTIVPYRATTLSSPTSVSPLTQWLLAYNLYVAIVLGLDPSGHSKYIFIYTQYI